MGYRILIADNRIWRKDCSAIPPQRVEQIFHKIRALQSDPWAGNVQAKQLKHYDLAEFRLRVGEYRVLFDKDEKMKTIVLLRVLHRSKFY